MLTNGQKRALHTAARRALGRDFSGAEFESMRRTIQRRIGGFHSAADKTATREGFIAVMAFYEQRCEHRGIQLAATPGYWQAQDRSARAGDALRYRLRAEAATIGMDEAALAAFLAGPHMSGGSCADVESATPYWLRRCLEAVKAIKRRQGQKQQRGRPGRPACRPGRPACRRGRSLR